MNAEAQLTKARAQLLMDQPFLAGLLMRLNLKPDATCETMWTDGREIGYNVKSVNSQQLVYLKSQLAHVTLHCAMRHFNRRNGREHGLWNAACDYVVNQFLSEQGFVLPTNALTDRRFRNMDADKIYAILKREQRDAQPTRNQNPTASPTSPAVNEATGQPASSPGQTIPGDPCNQTANSASKSDQQQPGTRSAKEPGAQTRKKPDPAYWGEVREARETPQSHAELDRAWKRAWTESRLVALKQGTLPQSLDRAVTRTMTPTIYWREALAMFLTSFSKMDYTFARPNRRFLHQSIYLPSMTEPSIGEVVVAVDTSGSVDQEQLDQFAAEITSLLQELRPECAHILLCDAAIQEIITHDPTDAPVLNLPLKGGGGTCFLPVFTWAEENANPVLLVYLTDLRGTFPETPPHYPVVWVVPDSSFPEPPFGDVLPMS